MTSHQAQRDLLIEAGQCDVAVLAAWAAGSVIVAARGFRWVPRAVAA